MSPEFPDYTKEIQESLRYLRSILAHPPILEALKLGDNQKMEKACEQYESARRAQMEGFLRILDHTPRILLELKKLIPPEVRCRGCSRPIGEEYYQFTRKILKPWIKSDESFYLHTSEACVRQALLK